MLKRILERVVKTGFLGVLPFFSCIVVRSPSYYLISLEMVQEMSCLRDIAYTAPFTFSILI